MTCLAPEEVKRWCQSCIQDCRWYKKEEKVKLKMATGYLGGRLQELADHSFVEKGRWMVSDFKTLKQAIDETFERDQSERRKSEIKPK